MMAALPQITQQNQQLMQAVQGMLQNAQGSAKQGAELAASGIADKSLQWPRGLLTTLTVWRMKTGLSEDQAEDFRIFALSAVTLLKISLTPSLPEGWRMTTKNSVQSGDMERLRDIAKRRQAFTGTVGNTPQSEMASETGVEAEGDSTLNRLAAQRRT